MTQILAGLGLFLLGLVLGSLFQRSRGNSAKEQRIEQKLSETEENFAKYQAEVSAHFVDTARKVQNLNNSYRDVHEQLAKGASLLCGENEGQDFLALAQANQAASGQTIDNPKDATPQEPPMDYAPKENPEEAGTLSEEYGLKDTPEANENAAEQNEDSENKSADVK